jgi:hypothetical protein
LDYLKLYNVSDAGSVSVILMGDFKKSAPEQIDFRLKM